MGELEKLAATVEAAIKGRIRPTEFRPGKVSVWIKMVKLVGNQEETAGHVHKVLLTAAHDEDLIRQLAENLVVATFGADVPLVESMPNLIVKLFDTKAYVAIPGAPPIDQAGQLFLKATVYPFEPSLWDQLFGKKERTG